jgi:hypothetical protein
MSAGVPTKAGNELAYIVPGMMARRLRMLKHAVDRENDLRIGQQA